MLTSSLFAPALKAFICFENSVRQTPVPLVWRIIQFNFCFPAKTLSFLRAFSRAQASKNCFPLVGEPSHVP